MNEQYEPISDPIEEPEWYVDLTAEEYAAFRMLMSRVSGPMRRRLTLIIIALVCCLAMVGMAVSDWVMAGMQGPFDWFTAVCGGLMLVPVGIWLYLPHHIRKQSLDHHRRSVAAGMVFTGRLTVTPEYVEKAGPTATAHIRLDERTLFLENHEMMVFYTQGSPALILPGRCLTDEMAAAVRRAADVLPPRNRRFIARVQTGGEIVTPVEVQTPEQVWTATFTYTHDEFATVMKNSVLRHFWRMAPWLTAAAMVGAAAFGWNGETLTPAIGYFLMFMGIFLLMNLVMPMLRVKGGMRNLSAHDLTMKVTFDTTALRMETPKSGNNWVLWCDVDHVYDRDPFAEMVLDKNRGALYIPKRAIPDIPAFEAALKRCRGEK